MSLNDIAIKSAKPKDKKYRVRDSDKLLLEIYPNRTKGWRVRYYRNGKERDVCLGNYPTEVIPVVLTGNSEFLACLFPYQAAFKKPCLQHMSGVIPPKRLCDLCWL